MAPFMRSQKNQKRASYPSTFAFLLLLLILILFSIIHLQRPQYWPSYKLMSSVVVVVNKEFNITRGNQHDGVLSEYYDNKEASHHQSSSSSRTNWDHHHHLHHHHQADNTLVTAFFSTGRFDTTHTRRIR
mmetsp:Transcript_1039/g.2035  ORF Transcript_1039/g.2035 Transcript_1039/m.2035 type:complete len:130 (-) Transcript_1039:357-746(-)